jgi:hypothetical protein
MRPRVSARVGAVASVVARVVFAGGLLIAVLSRVDPGAAAAEIRRAPMWAFVVPIALLLCNTCLHAIRVRLLAPEPRPPMRTFVRIVLLGNFFGLFLPTGGGDAAKVVALAPYAGGWERALAVQGTARVMELFPWMLLLFWGAGEVLPVRLPELVPLAIAAGVGFAGILALAALYGRHGHRVAVWLPARIEARIRRMAVHDVAPARLLACLALTFPLAAINSLIVWEILSAHDATVPLRDVLGMLPTADVLISLPITINGLGIREGLFVHCLAAWGVSAPVALAVAFTRWTGELGRAALGGIAFTLAHDRRRFVTAAGGDGS